jgi:hypothetical protein
MLYGLIEYGWRRKKGNIEAVSKTSNGLKRNTVAKTS